MAVRCDFERSENSCLENVGVNTDDFLEIDEIRLEGAQNMVPGEWKFGYGR